MLAPILWWNVNARRNGSTLLIGRNLKDASCHRTDYQVSNSRISFPVRRIAPPASCRRPDLVVFGRVAKADKMCKNHDMITLLFEDIEFIAVAHSQPKHQCRCSLPAKIIHWGQANKLVDCKLVCKKWKRRFRPTILHQSSTNRSPTSVHTFGTYHQPPPPIVSSK